jgi:hypothetical protein
VVRELLKGDEVIDDFGERHAHSVERKLSDWN